MKKVLFLMPFLFLTACGGGGLVGTSWENKTDSDCGLGDLVTFHKNNKATVMDGEDQYAMSYEEVSDNEYVFTYGSISKTFKIEQEDDNLKLGLLNDDEVCTFNQIDQ
ncbi:MULTISPECIES: hypothetical protein [Bacillus cereus group]|uniref:hypothetical protein n=1 Tax=Bacillus cereus group TaxID=86661 RepID=UPI000BED0C3A|nr:MULTISPECIES: hypothetical protein [Bacillus cereus group]KAA0766331.1 hypothetical protein DN410_03850 [Bacillus sp. SH5-2]PED02717.1 hypothetical protein CON14_11635 [Bacillus cereus]PEQ81969.1 hypothetical protein CN482_21360 [Bacillus cereus]PES08878.1 hypothetical protein CN501_25815 [Bacillus cereus]PEU09431.1 hypothetical protein CN531_16675 [Bacillus cereus]